MSIIDIFGNIGLLILIVWGITSIYTVITNWKEVFEVNPETGEQYTSWTNTFVVIAIVLVIFLIAISKFHKLMCFIFGIN